MAHTTPQVHGRTLTLVREKQPRRMLVESPGWWQWLDDEETTTFHFTSPQGSFTARRERKGAGHYWYAYRKVQGRLRKAYLGKSEELVLLRLELVARRLTEETPTSQGDHSQDAQPPALAKDAVKGAPPLLLLHTKLAPPPLRPQLVERPHLLERLSAGLQHKLTLIAAPAGFGKTTLLSAWCKLRDGAVPYAWLSLEPDDNDPIRFWTYIIAALRQLHPTMGDHIMPLMHLFPLPPLEVIVTALLNALTTLPDEALLILDDYHVITAQPIQESLTFMLDHLPPHLHLVLASRQIPSLPLIRLRAQGQLNELQINDLRFTEQEVRAFLRQSMGLRLSDQDIAALDAHTEGWVAGLQLAALSMQGREDSRAMTARFSGNHRSIVEYLSSEVLQRQPEHTQQFLLQTAILEQLTGDLCDALTGEHNGQAMLERLERANLFLIPLDEQRHWYRYHHLFAEFLRDRLRQDHPELPARLHRRASIWYEQNGFIAEALHHALAAQETERALHLIEHLAEPALMRGEAVTLVGWLASFPQTALHSHPLLRLFYAGALTAIGQLDAAEEHLLLAERAIQQMRQEQEGQQNRLQHLEGYFYVCGAVLAGYRADAPRTITLGRKALALVPGASGPWHAVVAVSLANASLLSGDLEQAGDAFAQAARLSQAVGHAFVFLASTAGRGYVLEQQGYLRQAAQIYTQAIETVSTLHGAVPPAAGIAYAFYGYLLYEWNRLEEAEHYAREGLELSKSWGFVGLAVSSFTTQAYINAARGDLEAALAWIQRAVDEAKAHDMPRFVALAAAHRAWFHWLRGMPEVAAQWAEACAASVHVPFAFLEEYEYLLLAQLRLAQGRSDEASSLLELLVPALETTGRRRTLVNALSLQAQALQAQGQRDRAIAALTRALSLAEPEGYLRTFLDQGTMLIPLLRQAAARGIAPAYVHRLLAAFGSRQAPGGTQPQGLLSEREMSVLRLIVAGKSTQDIAGELVVARSTVKTHLNTIYVKLGVHNRIQAIARARELHLL